MKKDAYIFIKHILESIKNIENFMENISKSYFLKNREKQSAVIREIEIIGEAVKNLPIEFTVKYPYVEWNKIAGARDKVIHHYFGVDVKKIWDIIKKDLPKLKEDILKIEEDLEKHKENNKNIF